MKAQIVHLAYHEFEHLKHIINDMFGERIDDGYAFSIILRDTGIIVVNKDGNLSEDQMAIVIQHERAHVEENIKDEEQADIWAMKYLTDTQKEVLRDNWEHRHGHPYPF